MLTVLLEPLQLPPAVPQLTVVTANHRSTVGELLAAVGAAAANLARQAS